MKLYKVKITKEAEVQIEAESEDEAIEKSMDGKLNFTWDYDVELLSDDGIPVVK